jgi:hypothetical protein
MKTRCLCISILIFYAFMLLDSASLQAQSRLKICDKPSYTSDTNAILDIMSDKKGILIPRLALVSTLNPIGGTKTSGMLVWNTSTSGTYPVPGYYYWDGTDWVRIPAAGSGTWNQNGNKLYYNSGNIGIGTNDPPVNLAIYMDDASVNSVFLIEQDGTGDASQQFLLSAGQSIVVGIDNNDNDNFKIGNSTTLTGTTYSDANTLVRVHTESGSEGIIDFNHQSRMRAYLNTGFTMSGSTWAKLNYSNESYDEKSEFDLTTDQFTAKEDGYYMITAICKYAAQDHGIRIVKNGTTALSVSESSKSASITMSIDVTDVVFLESGDTIQIEIKESNGNSVSGGQEYTYVSIHKLS